METKEIKTSTIYVLIGGEGEVITSYSNYRTAYKNLEEMEKKRHRRNPRYYNRMKAKYYPYAPEMTTCMLEVLINTAYESGNTYYDIIPTTLWED